MSILRIETKEIPAKTIETTIIGVPADEWKDMRLRKGFLTNFPPILLLTCMAGIMIFGAGYLPSIVNTYNIDTSSNHWIFIILGTALVIGTTVAASIILLPAKGTRLEHALLKRHGWDGESRYQVELEYQQFLHE
jgi:hypothetical protein